MPAPARRKITSAGAGPRSTCTTTGPTAAVESRTGPRRRPTASARAALACSALSLVTTATAKPALPYVPTTILLPPDGGSVAYIFKPSDDGSNSVDFLSLNISSRLHAASLQPTKLTSALPFLSSHRGNCATFAPSIFPNGTIAVLAGGCSGVSSPSLWTYHPGEDPSKWTRYPITTDTDTDTAEEQGHAPSGPYHLGGSLAFSAQLEPVTSDPTLYIYGGMCPFPNSTGTPSSWQSSAIYSNHMLRLSPPSADTNTNTNTNSYTLTSPSGPHPVPGAGFTLTQLTPSLSHRSDGVVTQQTSHVLLGGHTQTAFVNMSTAAVWSLPEETWSFVGIAGPRLRNAENGKPDLLLLAGREGGEGGGRAAVDSRSGHTAVLSEDGTRLVVYGGWVGEVSRAAAPQLAVVRIGVGMGDWEWEVPDLAEGGNEIDEGGRGVYGHGAALLPGNVMMVYGGYEIVPGADDNEKRMKRRRAAGEKMFFNITSMTWSDEYTNPLWVDSNGGNDASPPLSPPNDGGVESDDRSSRNRQIGLGVGLGVGLLVILIVSALVFRSFRRRQKRRASRDEAIRGLALGIHGDLPRGLGEGDEMLERDHSTGIFPWNAASAQQWYTGGHDPYLQGRRSLGYETLRGGSRPGPTPLYIPPTPWTGSSSGRPRAARGLYQPSTGIGSASSHDFTPLTRGTNRIEPIYEADEDEDGDLGRNYPLSPDREDDDPFLTPTPTGGSPVGGLFPPQTTTNTGGSGTASPDSQFPPAQGRQEQDADVQGWVSDADAADAMLAARIGQRDQSSANPTMPMMTLPPPPWTGRGSPSRRPSTRSGGSSRHSHSAPTDSDDGGGGRTGSNLSERSAFSFAPGAEGGGLTSRLFAAAAARITGGSDQGQAQARDQGPPRQGSSSSGSGSSAKTFNTARSGFAALQAEGPGLLFGGGGPGNNKNDDGDDDDEEDKDPADVPGSPSKSKSKPRRGWFGSLRRRVFSGGDRITPETASSPARESLLEGGASSDSYYGPRLAGAGGQVLQRRRQGREAWAAASGGDGGGGGGDDEEEEEWDIERAVEQRLVQVVFTVPRERLRVVNAEVEREEEERSQSAEVVDPDSDDEPYAEHPSSPLPPAREPSAQEENPRPSPGPSPSPSLRPPEPAEPASTTTTTTTALEPPGVGAGISPSPSIRTAAITTPTLHTAEAVRLERPPRTRVLEMVESIESRSRESSPGTSPVRGSSHGG
ncbi:hypothetical protein VTK56DRAFT_7512 [Thermocarpiscus australiensis]